MKTKKLEKMETFYKFLVINGCVSLMIAGIFIGLKGGSIGLAFANVCIGIANLIFMLR